MKIIESKWNRGLADSIIEGVTTVVNKHRKVIVLEDDVVVSTGFLKYMNEALNLYENEEKVMHISGYMFPVKGVLPETFFYRQTSCWGWGTWSDKWKKLERSAPELHRQMKESGKLPQADIDGTNQFIGQLIANVEGRLKTWGVLWHFSVLINEGLCLHPARSLAKNIGMDNSGENCIGTNIFDVELTDYVAVKKIQVKDYLKVYPYLRNFYGTNKKNNLLTEAKRKLFKRIPDNLKHRIKKLIQ